ncbi:MAG TPA: HEPN domain-containing protein [Burkholderiales bacterium]|nr:HEPN domain-containing protein [Burkholderiales bacterium]
MKPLAREWVAKAEADFATARRELLARRQPNYDAACFHAQQCAEKYLKALLQERGCVIPRAHHLEMLAKPLLAAHPAFTIASGNPKMRMYACAAPYNSGRGTRQAGVVKDGSILALFCSCCF